MCFLRRHGVVFAVLALAGCSSDAPFSEAHSRELDVAASLSDGGVVRINFQDAASPAPEGYFKDFGEPFGERALADQGQLTYGWVVPGTNTPVDLSSNSTGSGNGRNRGIPADARLATLVHMQAEHLLPGFAGTRQNGAWQVALDDGSYTVSLSVGDGVYLDSTHGVNVEGVEAISGFTPTTVERFRAAEVDVHVSDGALTVEATGVNTKLNYVEIRASDVPCGSDAEVITPLPCPRLVVRAPFHNGFSAELPGVADASGASTGFTVALATPAGPGHRPQDLRVDPVAGELALTTGAGISAGTTNSQSNALGVGLALPNGIFRVETLLLDPPRGSGGYEQAGLWLGKSQRDFAKLALISGPGGLVVQVALERDDVARGSVDLRIDALPERARLALEVDPTLRELRAYVTLTPGAGERLVGVMPDVPESWLGLTPDREASLPSAYAGVFATHRNRPSELGALTYRFGEFSVVQRVGLPNRSNIDAARWRVVPAFPDVTFVNPTGLVEAPGTGHVFITEREGRVFAVPLQSAEPEKKPVLDLSAVTQGHNDLGLLGIALHPEFGDRTSPNGRFMYLHYPYTPTPASSPVPLDWPTESRLSRFSVDLDTLVADPGSELVLIAQQDDHIWHQGGAMFFHPQDGFLYLTVGDEGDSLCSLGNCQRIDRDLFSGVLRIDVDMRGGDISHPIGRQPERGATANYYIPNDNPFVGQADVLEEFYALGLRSPHRMTHDPVDGITWIGDVGQNQREELNVLGPGANFQWELSEGTFQRYDMSEAPLGVWTDPVLELSREESVAVIGGFVYRGTRLPDLAGKFIFGDYSYGTIWALDYEYDGTSTRVLGREQLLTTLLGRSSTLTSFGVDLSGELYLLTMGQASRVQRLERGSTSETVPARLSRVGAFEDLRSLKPVPGAVPYTVQNPLFSDGSSKRRWMLPAASGTIGFSEHGPWRFPEGTVFVKHFELALDERRPEQRRRLETRFLVAAQGGAYYGITYKWNAAGTEAEPVFASEVEDIEVVEANGRVRQQSYFYPGPNECMVCHNADAGYVLGVRTAQLNGALGGVGREQLIDWSERGLLDSTLDAEAVAALPSLAPLDDESRSLEERVRSYWDSNCSMCHGVMQNIRSTWDARYQTPLAEQGVIYGTLSSDAEVPEDSFVVVPGDPARSALWLRDSSTEPGLRMPPLGRHRVDEAYIELLEQWISSL